MKVIETWDVVSAILDVTRLQLVEHEMTYGPYFRGLRLLWSFRTWSKHGATHSTEPRPFFSREHARQTAIAKLLADDPSAKLRKV